MGYPKDCFGNLILELIFFFELFAQAMWFQFHAGFRVFLGFFGSRAPTDRDFCAPNEAGKQRVHIEEGYNRIFARVSISTVVARPEIFTTNLGLSSLESKNSRRRRTSRDALMLPTHCPGYPSPADTQRLDADCSVNIGNVERELVIKVVSVMNRGYHGFFTRKFQVTVSVGLILRAVLKTRPSPKKQILSRSTLPCARSTLVT
jgi:hypothetical protein